MEYKLQTSMESYAETLIERAHKLTPGSEEESREVENIAKLIRLINEQDRLEAEKDKNERDYELNRHRLIDESAFKEKQLRFENERGKKINPNTIFTCVFYGGVGVLLMATEYKGGIITPRFVTKLIDRLPKFGG